MLVDEDGLRRPVVDELPSVGPGGTGGCASPSAGPLGLLRRQVLELAGESPIFSSRPDTWSCLTQLAFTAFASVSADIKVTSSPVQVLRARFAASGPSHHLRRIVHHGYMCLMSRSWLLLVSSMVGH